jgi:hypothetical protein
LRLHARRKLFFKGGGIVQMVVECPEFKPQYHKEKKLFFWKLNLMRHPVFYLTILLIHPLEYAATLLCSVFHVEIVLCQKLLPFTPELTGDSKTF